MSTSLRSISSRSTDLPDLPATTHHGAVVLGRAQAVDARHAGHDDHVAAADQGAGGGQAQAVDLVVDRGVLLDVDVALGDVRFGLVVVVVADEVVDGVVGEELLELGVELGGQVLLCDMTSVGRCSAWMTLAMVNVLPEPVTPISTCKRNAAAHVHRQRVLHALLLEPLGDLKHRDDRRARPFGDRHCVRDVVEVSVGNEDVVHVDIGRLDRRRRILVEERIEQNLRVVSFDQPGPVPQPRQHSSHREHLLSV
jgi:hypothetical protein